MKFPKISSPVLLSSALSLTLAGLSQVSAQTIVRSTRTAKPVTKTIVATNDTGTSSTSAATDPVGFTTADLPANTDSLISIPFTRPAVFSGTISSVSNNVITVAASPGWSTNQYTYSPASSQTNTYYAIIGPNFAPVTGTVSATNGSATLMGSGSAFSQMVAGDEILINGTAATVASVTSATALTLVSPFIGTTVTGASATFDHSPKEGSYYTVTANGTNSLTVNLNGDSLSSIASNLGSTTVTLIPYWTLGTAFPASDAGASFATSSGIQPRFRQTQILLPDQTNAGIDLAPSAIFYNYGGVWTADGSTSANDTVLPPTTYFTVRNSSTATKFTPSGGVYMNRFTAPLDTQASGGQDNAVAFVRPTAVTLNDLGLIVSGAFSLSTGDQPRFRTDTLFVFNNAATGIDKSPSAIYYYYNGGWRLSGAQDTSVDYGTTTIPYGTGFKIRKASNAQGATSFWQNTRNY